MICSLAVHAQNPMPLAMDKAIELSLQNSKQLKVNKAKIEAATGQLKHALDNRLPDAKISGAYMFLTSPNIDLKTGESNGGGSSAFPRPNQAMYGMASVNMPLYSGLKIRYGIESAKFLEKAAEAGAGRSAGLGQRGVLIQAWPTPFPSISRQASTSRKSTTLSTRRGKKWRSGMTSRDRARPSISIAKRTR